MGRHHKICFLFHGYVMSTAWVGEIFHKSLNFSASPSWHPVHFIRIIYGNPLIYNLQTCTSKFHCFRETFCVIHSLVASLRILFFLRTVQSSFVTKNDVLPKFWINFIYAFAPLKMIMSLPHT